jgi:hypothetical protein
MCASLLLAARLLAQAPATSDLHSDLHPPIPVRFHLDSASYVTLVVDDAQGNRVRNLISDTLFQAGDQTVWWDGTDDLGRNADAANHGLYLMPTHFVAPGHYTVRGLTHKAIDLHYEFSIYNAGHPAWETADGKGGWLTNHTPPSSTLFVPADKAPGGKPLMFLGSYVSEGGSGLAWVDLDGNKQGGRGWIGGAWTAAPYLARDTGPQADPTVYAYVGAAWRIEAGKDAKLNHTAEIRLTALTPKGTRGSTYQGDRIILTYHYEPGDKLDKDETGRPIWSNQMEGLAVRNNLAVMSLTRIGKLLFADTTTKEVLGLADVPKSGIAAEPAPDLASDPAPRGLAFDPQGRLLVLSGTRLLRYTLPAKVQPDALPAPQVLISTGLEDPVGITTDANGDIYISDRGKSHQVKVFSAAGKLLRTIGHPGVPAPGPYDPLHMNNPRGLALDSNHHLWVAEEDFQPKRVSVWDTNGQLLKTFYGPSEYGGGGELDPQDRTRFYYHQMEFKLDWAKGTDTLSSVLFRPNPDAGPVVGREAFPLPPFGGATDVVYAHGHRYFSNSYQGHPSFGVAIGVVYLDTGGILHPVAALGRANDWPLLATAPFLAQWPKGTDPKVRTPNNSVLFTWSDTNGNGQVDPEEVTVVKSLTTSIAVMPDLAMIDAFEDGRAMRYAPVSFSPAGIPFYDLQHGEVIATGVQKAHSDGGGQAICSPQATVFTTAPTPFSADGVGGIDKAGHRWSYPSLWPGLHPSHSAPVADHPGELIGTTRLLGGFVTPKGADPNGAASQLWAINGNFGDVFLFTADGLFVTQLFQDGRTGRPWNMPQTDRNLLLNDVSLHEENFNPTITQTSDGKIYLVDGIRTSLVRVDGLDTLRKLGPIPIELSKSTLDQAQSFLKASEAQRQQKLGPKTVTVPLLLGPAPSLATFAESVPKPDWVEIDRRITQVGWNAKPDLAEGALAVADRRLFAAFRTSDPNLLKNTGAVANAPFKTGGALDLMIGADAKADPKRPSPVAGDQRLLVYLIDGKPRALLYRAVVPGTATPIAFSSPGRTITLDQVEDVTSQLQFQANGGNYAFSIPLETLGLKPAAGTKIKADIGILRGSGGQTIQRAYWSNKATGITADVPTEAELTPNLWGEWVFQPVP